MKKLFLFFTLILAIKTYSNTINTTFNQSIQSIEQSKGTASVVTDYKDADFFLENNQFNKQVLNETVLIFPNVKIFERNSERLSKISKSIYVFLLQDIANNSKLKNRSVKELSKKNYSSNIKIIAISINKEYENEILSYLENDILTKTSFFKQVILNKLGVKE